MINEDNKWKEENKGNNEKKNKKKMKRVNDEVRMEQLGKIGDIEIGIGKNDKNKVEDEGKLGKKRGGGIVYSADELKKEIKKEELMNEVEYEEYEDGMKIPKKVYEDINRQIMNIFMGYPIRNKKKVRINIDKGYLKYLKGIIKELKERGYKAKIDRSGEWAYGMGIIIWV